MGNFLLRLALMGSKQILILCGIAGAAYYFMIFDDGTALRTQISGVQAEIKKEEVKAAEADKALKEVEAIRASLNTLGQQFQLATKQLPSQYSMPELIRAIDSIARASGVSIKSKEPMAPKPEKDGIVEYLPVKVVLEGQYSEIAMFIYYISSLERITRVKNFDMGVPTGADIRKPRLQVDAEVMSYRFTGKTPAKGVN